MIFIDTNYLLRFFLADLEDQHNQARKLLVDAAAGRIKLFTSTVVVFELYWVLRSFYQKDRRQIFQTLKDFLDLEFIHVEERATLKDSLETFERSTLSLVDCYNLAFAKSRNAKDFKTFDRKLAKYFS
ncbi:MAG: hypothetical protein A3F35_03510 [Candidatus Woykebacteria bacterium RIFCSPHIGHO2_12_FULL_45_10]|uniref:PIN domain-containing protein n=1 Tax=Candidatus Woykebacteria bacterium RIFCSPHIGHO2_12_FULL_45_10 TaxID=1802603 RepID=A0A1G1WTG8_9BACT|nr:MAG: hypothetical protein A3F35_03510 [Candidatus Woykebacteria bacterium RIFCSPHIGHO2_12_FULL_45_10]